MFILYWSVTNTYYRSNEGPDSSENGEDPSPGNKLPGEVEDSGRVVRDVRGVQLYAFLLGNASYTHQDNQGTVLPSRSQQHNRDNTPAFWHHFNQQGKAALIAIVEELHLLPHLTNRQELHILITQEPSVQKQCGVLLKLNVQ